MKIQQHDVDIKRKNIPEKTDLAEVYALIERVTNKTYASAVLLELQEEESGFDFFEVCDKDGKILIRASCGVSLAAGFNAYLKERCGYSIGALTTSGSPRWRILFIPRKSPWNCANISLKPTPARDR